MDTVYTKQYSMLSDHMNVYDFMVDIYERDLGNGVPAPFLEYALVSDWMDKSYTHRNRIWYEDNRIIGFCFYENPVTDIYFSLRPGYDKIAPDMIAYADAHMPCIDGKRRFVLMDGQRALINAAEALRYEKKRESPHKLYDFSSPLERALPEGFSFTRAGELDVAKCLECCWKGFGHEEEEGVWPGDIEYGLHLTSAPHATTEHALAVINERGEYVCYAGMWWTPKNKLAYMEPLCTIPEYRSKGLAAAALSELYRRMKPLGATHMTGGSNPFYTKLGYYVACMWTYWEKRA